MVANSPSEIISRLWQIDSTDFIAFIGVVNFNPVGMRCTQSFVYHFTGLGFNLNGLINSLLRIKNNSRRFVWLLNRATWKSPHKLLRLSSGSNSFTSQGRYSGVSRIKDNICAITARNITDSP